jgi:hypothetical protein
VQVQEQEWAKATLTLISVFQHTRSVALRADQRRRPCLSWSRGTVATTAFRGFSAHCCRVLEVVLAVIMIVRMEMVVAAAAAAAAAAAVARRTMVSLLSLEPVRGRAGGQHTEICTCPCARLSPIGSECYECSCAASTDGGSMPMPVGLAVSISALLVVIPAG